MQTIPFINLLYLIFPLIIVFIFYYKWSDESADIPYATVRMVAQLILIGYLLIYIFENKNPYIAMAIILFMGLVSAKITLRNTQNRSFRHYVIIFASIISASLIHLILIILFVLDLDNYYDPRYVIPIAGMIFANTMNALSLCVERFEKEEQRESYVVSRKVAFKAAMIPQINALLAVGLVALPGMMTGQILSGIDPLIAIRYQIMIMSMTLSTAGISIVMYFYLKERF